MFRRMKRVYKVKKNRSTKATFQNTVFHQGGEVRFGAMNMVPLSVVLGLQGDGLDETPAFIPFDLVGSEHVLLRYANMYEQFRIDWIEVTFEPVARPPTVVVTAGDPITVPALEAWQRNWVIRFPYKTNEDVLEMGDMPIARAIEDPNTLFKKTYTKFKLWWRPQVKGGKNLVWWTDKDGGEQPAKMHTHNVYSGQRFGWNSFLSWTLMNAGDGRTYTTAALRQQMSEPYVGIVNAAGNRVQTTTGCPYKIQIRSGWSFRGYRKMTSQFITSLEEKDPFPADED